MDTEPQPFHLWGSDLLRLSVLFTVVGAAIHSPGIQALREADPGFLAPKSSNVYLTFCLCLLSFYDSALNESELTLTFQDASKDNHSCNPRMTHTTTRIPQPPGPRQPSCLRNSDKKLSEVKIKIGERIKQPSLF